MQKPDWIIQKLNWGIPGLLLPLQESSEYPRYRWEITSSGFPSGTGINAVSSLGEVRVRFPISENDYLNFVREFKKDPKANSFRDVPVDLILGDGSVFGEKGNLQLTNRQIDPNTGSILIQAIFKNTSGILRPGQYIKVRFRTGEFKNAVLIPQQSVNQLQNIFQVYLLTDSNKIKTNPDQSGKPGG